MNVVRNECSVPLESSSTNSLKYHSGARISAVESIRCRSVESITVLQHNDAHGIMSVSSCTPLVLMLLLLSVSALLPVPLCLSVHRFFAIPVWWLPFCLTPSERAGPERSDPNTLFRRWIRTPPMPGIGCLGKFYIRCPGIGKSGLSDFRKSGFSEIRKSRNPTIWIFGFLDFRIFGNRNSGIPENPKKPDVQVFRFSGFSENRKFQKSGKWYLRVDPKQSLSNSWCQSLIQIWCRNPGYLQLVWVPGRRAILESNYS